MRQTSKIVGITMAIALVFFILPPIAVALENDPLLPDGVLISEASSPKIYFIENGVRRWIESEAAFLQHAFRWEDIAVVIQEELNRYAEGEVITATSLLFPDGRDLLPDLAPFANQDFRFAYHNGRRVIKFSTIFWNRGRGAMELFTDAQTPPEDGRIDTYQRIQESDGSDRSELVGQFEWHALHNHYHHRDFGEYQLELIQAASSDPPLLPEGIIKKTNFCLRDNFQVRQEESEDSPEFALCGQERQGVSVGWADVYEYTLPDQFIDVHDLPPGIYKLSFHVDPLKKFVESRRDNNVSVVLLELDVQKGVLNILAAAAPFSTAGNYFPNGTLIRAEGDSRVYEINNNKKRHLRTPEIFLSYGYSWNDNLVLPRSIVDVIPIDQLIRADDSPHIYFLNRNGFKRRIVNLEVLSSYGIADDDITQINQIELAGYPNTDLIRRLGESDVFSLNARRKVGRFEDLASLGYYPNSVHSVNETDFNAYIVQVVARNLTIPWDIAFLPDGDMLVTERPGTLRRIGEHPAIISIPGVEALGEGGLMGIALHPDFEQNQLLYLYFTATENGNRAMRYRLEGDELVDATIIIDNIPEGIFHDGGQIAFGPDGMLYITTGDASKPDSSQDINSLSGKTLRLTPDGDIPSDNPFGTAVWSWGHRNAQGMAWDDAGRMWETEHGRSGKLSGLDEINLIKKGLNYGWPIIQGDEQRADMVTPVINSGPDVTWAPAGLAYHNGSLYFAGLRGSSLYEAVLDGENVIDFKVHLAGQYGRLRGVVLGPDGFLYVTTSNQDGRGTVREGDDKILRIHQEFLR